MEHFILSLELSCVACFSYFPGGKSLHGLMVVDEG